MSTGMAEPKASAIGATRFIVLLNSSSHQALFAEVVAQHALQRLAALDPVVQDAVPGAEALDRARPAGVALAVQVDGPLVERDVDEAPRLAVDQLQVPADAGAHLGR